jgi:hypothetical protein
MLGAVRKVEIPKRIVQPMTVRVPMRIAVEKANDERLALLELSGSDMAYRGILSPVYTAPPVLGKRRSR